MAPGHDPHLIGISAAAAFHPYAFFVTTNLNTEKIMANHGSSCMPFTERSTMVNLMSAQIIPIGIVVSCGLPTKVPATVKLGVTQIIGFCAKHGRSRCVRLSNSLLLPMQATLLAMVHTATGTVNCTNIEVEWFLSMPKAWHQPNKTHDSYHSKKTLCIKQKRNHCRNHPRELHKRHALGVEARFSFKP